MKRDTLLTEYDDSARSVAVAIDVVGAHIEIVEGASGPRARIAGSRIRVQDVVFWYETQGMSVDEIVEGHPTINHAIEHHPIPT